MDQILNLQTAAVLQYRGILRFRFAGKSRRAIRQV